MLRIVQTCLVLIAVLSLILVEAADTDRCTQSPEDTVQACAACVAKLHISMDVCCTSDEVLQFCQNLPELEASALSDNALVGNEIEGPESKRARYFLGKRNNRYLLGKRPRNNFLGKRGDSDELMGQEDMLDDSMEKRRRPFLGKRGPRPFLGKRGDEFDDEEKRARPFLGKRDGDDTFDDTFEEKRARPFLGKRRRPFLGKRGFESEDEESLSDVIKRAKYFLGKKAKYFLGKRSDDEIADSAQVSFNDMDSESDVKRQQKYFLG